MNDHRELTLHSVQKEQLHSNLLCLVSLRLVQIRHGTRILFSHLFSLIKFNTLLSPGYTYNITYSRIPRS